MSILGTVMLILMAATSAALAVAWKYEHEIRLSTLREWQNLYAEYGKLISENAANREELAMHLGEVTGRECDTLQREMARRIGTGNGFSIRFGGKSA